jgi:hypothetical protein
MKDGAKLTLDKLPANYTTLNVSNKSEIIIKDTSAYTSTLITTLDNSTLTASVIAPVRVSTGAVPATNITPTNEAIIDLKGGSSYATAAAAETINGFTLTFDKSLTPGGALTLINRGSLLPQEPS